MTRRVDDTAPAKEIKAGVILNRKGKYVGKVQIRFARSGGCLVNVLQSYEAAEKSGGDHMAFQHAKAGGYGYDKATACLSGMVIDGHKMTNHCDRTGAPKPPKGRATYPSDAKPKRGFSFANYAEVIVTGKGRKLKASRVDSFRLRNDAEYQAEHAKAEKEGRIEKGFTDCYRLSGFDYLEALGYQILWAI